MADLSKDKSPHDRYLDSLVYDMRKAVSMFRKFDKQWNELNDALDAKYDAEGQHDPILRDRGKNANLELAGYFSAGNWWRDKANMIANVLQAEQGLRR